MKTKLIALGDSIIKGVLLNIETTGQMHYALADNNIVDQVAHHLRVEPVNLGKMGCTFEVGERILDRHLAGLENVNYAKRVSRHWLCHSLLWMPSDILSSLPLNLVLERKAMNWNGSRVAQTPFGQVRSCTMTL